MIVRGLIPVLLLAAIALAAPAYGSDPVHQVAAYGATGELYQVRAGSYSALFPDGPEALGDTSVLRLEVIDNSGARTSHLVPGSAAPDIDTDPVVIYESGHLFLLWASHDGSAMSRINLVQFDGNSWSAPIEVSGDPVPLKGPPRVAITRDRQGEGALAESRVVVHLVWWEDDGNGEDVFYSPVVLIGGAYIGWNPVFSLDQFDQNPAASSADQESGLYRAANVQKGADVASVVVALPRLETARTLPS